MFGCNREAPPFIAAFGGSPVPFGLSRACRSGYLKAQSDHTSGISRPAFWPSRGSGRQIGSFAINSVDAWHCLFFIYLAYLTLYS
jgi:hypothetical protein